MCPHYSAPGDDGESGFPLQFLLLPQPNTTKALNLPFQNIIWVLSVNDNVSKIFFTHPKTGKAMELPYARGVGKLEKDFRCFPLLCRVHRSHIVNYEKVLYFDWRTLQAEFYDELIIPLSRVYKKRVLAKIGHGCNTHNASQPPKKAFQPPKNAGNEIIN